MKLTPEQQKTVERLMPRAAALARALRPADEDLVSEAYLRLCEAVLDPTRDTDGKILGRVKSRLLNWLDKEHRRDHGREVQFGEIEDWHA